MDPNTPASEFQPQATRRFQFPLAALIGAVFMFGVLFAMLRWWGPYHVLPSFVLCVLAGRLIRRPASHMFLWLLPPAWSLVCGWAFHHPGDEYGLWFFGSLAGAWPAAFHVVGEVKRFLPIAILTGAATVGVLAWFLDWLRVNWRLFFSIQLIAAIGFCYFLLAPYPTWERAISKNGSITAYVLYSINVGMYAAIVFSVLATLVRRFWVKLASSAVPQTVRESS